MAHQRKLIRQATVALLKAANTAAGARVQGTRVEPSRSRDLPAISVYTLGDETDMEISEQSAPRELTRDLNLEIVAIVAHADSYPADDAMDDIAEQIEAVMDQNRYLSGTAAESILTGTVMEVAEADGKSDPLVGFVALTYKVKFRTDATLPDAKPADFTDINATTTIQGGVPDTAPAVDNFNPQVSP